MSTEAIQLGGGGGFQVKGTSEEGLRRGEHDAGVDGLEELEAADEGLGRLLPATDRLGGGGLGVGGGGAVGDGGGAGQVEKGAHGGGEEEMADGLTHGGLGWGIELSGIWEYVEL